MGFTCDLSWNRQNRSTIYNSVWQGLLPCDQDFRRCEQTYCHHEDGLPEVPKLPSQLRRRLPQYTVPAWASAHLLGTWIVAACFYVVKFSSIKEVVYNLQSWRGQEHQRGPRALEQRHIGCWSVLHQCQPRLPGRSRYTAWGGQPLSHSLPLHPSRCQKVAE